MFELLVDFPFTYLFTTSHTQYGLSVHQLQGVAMNRSLQEEVTSLSKKLQLLAISPGFIDTGTTNGVREFYEGWQAINAQCIRNGHEDSGADLSFVAEQLRALLAAFPTGKTTVGVLEVFPQCFESALLFGSYIYKLEQIGKTAQTHPA